MRKQELKPTILVIFGISGDLSQRFLLPGLVAIKKAGQLPGDLQIMGISRRDITKKDALGTHHKQLGAITQLHKMDLDKKTDYQLLKANLQKHKSAQIIFYLAVPPQAVLPIIRNLGQARLNGCSTKLLLEKPFGTDLKSAQELIKEADKHFKEEQIYRIDHYLAKEVVQNIATFLGSNVIFRNLWNNQFIDYIEIVAAERIGIEGRVDFYEQNGALRDFIQGHLLQLAALTLMEPCPPGYDFAELPARRLAALKAISVPAHELNKTVVRAQYQGYTKEVDNPDSQTETFVAVQVRSSNPRWQGVPIYLASGKKLDQKLTQISVNFKKSSKSEANRLILRIQPKESIELDLWIKEPGYEHKLRRIAHRFDYDYHFGRLPDAYEQVIVDAIRGSHSLFASSGETIESWRIIQPILDHWGSSRDDLKAYKPGSPVAGVLGS